MKIQDLYALLFSVFLKYIRVCDILNNISGIGF